MAAALEQFADLTAAQRVERYYTAVTGELCRRSLRKFVYSTWPLIDPAPFTPNWHIDAICDHLAYVAMGDIRNLMINVPPRSSKSSVVSVAFPAWIWADNPEEQFLCASYAADLAKLDAAKMRRLVESEWYQSRYPGVIILSDENRIDRFSTLAGGYRTTISVGSKTTGLGGNYQILDDPHNTAEIEHEAARKEVITWHDGAFRSRVNNPNTARRIYVGQRSHALDLFAHVLEKEAKRWVVLELPMEYEPDRKCITYINRGKGPEGEPIFKDPRTKPGSLLCPARYDEDAVAREKEAVSERVWEAQFQQRPQGAGGKIWKSKWWRKWEWPKWHPEYRKGERPLPEFIEIIQSYDTNFEEDEQDSFCVRTTWGVFLHQEMVQGDRGRIGYGMERVNGMLLERKKWRPGFGEMRDEAVESFEMWEEAGLAPDRILVEKKASGHSLVKELRHKKLPVRAVKIQGDLVYRAHMASLPLQKGAIWYVDKPWARAFIQTCAQFPDVEFDDEIASAAIALMYMRKHMDLQLEDDDDNEDDLALFDPKIARRSFYG